MVGLEEEMGELEGKGGGEDQGKGISRERHRDSPRQNHDDLYCNSAYKMTKIRN